MEGWRAFLVIVGSMAIAASVCYLLYHHERLQSEHTILERETLRVTSMARGMGDEMHAAAADLQVMANSETLADYLRDGSKSHLERFSREALNLMSHQYGYDFIRLLDESGRELMRVSARSGIAPPADLEDKSDRPFYKRAIGMPRGGIFMSNLDLYIEHNKVFFPIRPSRGSPRRSLTRRAR